MSKHRADVLVRYPSINTSRYTDGIRRALNTPIPLTIGHVAFGLATFALGYGAMAFAQALWPEAAMAIWPALWRVGLALVVVTYAVQWGLDFLLRPFERAVDLAPDWDEVTVTITADTSKFDAAMKQLADIAERQRRFREHR